MTSNPFSHLNLDGTVVTDSAATAFAAADFGGIVNHPPLAVLHAKSAADIETVLPVAAASDVPVVPRGCGHTSLGQAQVLDGLVIDLTALDEVHDLTDDQVTVGAGATWNSLLARTLQHGLTPRVLTDYLGTSVGGTLSVGGIGGTSHRYGVQTDNALALDVVTADGVLRHCSPAELPDLFHAVLGGFGQCGVIVRATLPLIPAPERVRRFKVYYPTIEELFASQRRLLADGRFDFLQGEILPTPDGWIYMLDVASYYTPPHELADDLLTSGIGFVASRDKVEDLSYWEFATRLDETVTYLEGTGEWQAPHPWPNLLLPDAQVDAFMSEVMADLVTTDLGASGLILIYPMTTAAFGTQLFRHPETSTVYLVAGLRFATDAVTTQNMVAANRRWYEAALGLGGTSYPTGAIPFTEADWTRHLGTAQAALAEAKARYDPLHLFPRRFA
ncbi:FAD/FMN-containing dehydrogenase [Amycolatopsis pretoriensis]|uniref:FAD/FMN-containing dehydrogenase n=1 Tax=Amycolatopsis pretoriensis TaxID=218821 RepID=A0A1H5RLJ4_9PSEU|nr:FAD-binding protein [Amycolatopsis pretoriensis]SEF38391.1 FAD/FMN-containing dehydrogenase [Amycolatopsis pretoriensis]